MIALLAFSLALLLANAWRYRFLCDDAFISFRYARNLSHGYGLVFNPGLERVEGFSNFFWTVLLAGLDRLGIAPEHAATPLSLLFTVALWAVVVRFAWRRAGPGREWLTLIPAFLLAVTRSVAVWSTSGLETRCFEFFSVAGVLQLIEETERIGGGLAPGRPLAGWLLGLAALTRPDGLLVAAAALASSAALIGIRRARERAGGALARFAAGARAAIGAALRRGWPCAALVLALIAFRLGYYHQLLPNTYYVKVGGRFLWAQGLEYLEAFALEYGAALWIPLIAIALVAAWRRRAIELPAIALGVLVPHVLYVVAVGGDHFEYRPLDLAFPIVFLLIADGVRAAWGGPLRRIAVAAALALIALALVWLPEMSRREFPAAYRAGFPGCLPEGDADARHWLDPARDPLFSRPPLRAIALAHRALLFKLSSGFTALRAEEHAKFYVNARRQALLLRGLEESGVLPRETIVAMSSVGVIPYVTDLPTLDRLGLTDATVAHSAFLNTMSAHGKAASLDYARSRHVDLWFYDPVMLTHPLLARRMLLAVVAAGTADEDLWVAEVAPDTFAIAMLPQGIASAARRVPRLEFRSLRDTKVRAEFFRRAVAAQRGVVARRPGDLEELYRLADYLYRGEYFAEAEPLFRGLVAAAPEDSYLLYAWAVCQLETGDRAGALATLERDAALLRGLGDEAGAQALEPTIGLLRGLMMVPMRIHIDARADSVR